jgi:polyphosphate kinase
MPSSTASSSPASGSYISRDISWLAFNHRVLQEAADHRVPLYERIKFLAIYSSNLDEFFRVRVAALRSFKLLRKETREQIPDKPKKTLKQILEIVGKQQVELGRIFREEILNELSEVGIKLLNQDEMSSQFRKEAEAWFDANLVKLVRIERFSPGQKAPFLRNSGIYFAFRLGEQDLGLINLPTENLPRFIELGEKDGLHPIAWIDDILRLNLPRAVGAEYGGSTWAVKLSRDAELYIDDEFNGDLVDKIRQGLVEREAGLPTRFLYDASLPLKLRSQLAELLNLQADDMVAGGVYHNFHDLFSFPDPIGDPTWRYRPFPPQNRPFLDDAESMFDAIIERDRVLHFPYQRFDYIVRMLEEAADDPNVETIRITLYRVGRDSAVARALIRAARNGKQVTAFLEIKARFDEESNLQWGAALEQAGAQVLYSYPGIKVHTKLFVISRRESNAIRHYAYLGTGNFNEKTATIYADHALLTCDPRLADEALQIFEVLERRRIITNTKHLLIAPFSLRNGFQNLIRTEIMQARSGNKAYIIAKMNSLEDPEMMRELAEAAKAGVSVQLIVRGICCLKPENPEFGGRLRIISIVDRFLEHSRLYVFGNGGKEKLFIASADWMTRNLDRRIEMAVPIYDRWVYAELRQLLDLQLADNVKARVIDDRQRNHYVQHKLPALRAQEASWQLCCQWAGIKTKPRKEIAEG